MTTFLEAIAREEGFYVKDTRAQRNRNPGNIEYGKFSIAHDSQCFRLTLTDLPACQPYSNLPIKG